LIRLKGLNFEVGKAYVRPEYYPLLTKVLQASRIIESRSIVVEGHTDTTGTSALNQVLSQERAESVRAYIANNGGLSAERINAIGFGPDKPIAPNTTVDGRRLNRRTDIVFRTG
jgi:outer membrane protein OmpA-like peptidoglycan-associated protein